MPGIFFRSTRSARPAAGAAAAGAGSTLSWARLAFAAGLLAALLAAALWTAGSPGTEQLHTMMLHSFELVLGAVLGILTGEAAHSGS